MLIPSVCSVFLHAFSLIIAVLLKYDRAYIIRKCSMLGSFLYKFKYLTMVHPFFLQQSVNSDIWRYLLASHEDTPVTDTETHRLAVVNMDWDHIKVCDTPRSWS